MHPFAGAGRVGHLTNERIDMAEMTQDPAAVDALKQVHRGTWAAGDYPGVATYIDEVLPRHLLERVRIEPGQDVLDVATGTGNTALRAAKAGARVIGLDLTPELFEAARRRATEWDVQVEWMQGDAEALPFEDESFDRVLSTVGVQFAPRHEVAARELARVCKPGGVIGLVNWTPSGLIGRMFGVLGRYMPKPPAFASPPPKWGDEEHVRSLFAGTGIELEFERGVNPWRFESSEALMKFWETQYGPTLKAREKLTADGQWQACRADLVAVFDELNIATDGTLHVDAEYVVIVGRKPA
jgi:SAM-dependent methyltransferase